MSGLLFLAGMGAGAFTTVIGVIALIGYYRPDRDRKQEDVDDANERSVAALLERNAIGRDQADSLRKIAETCEHKFWGGGGS